MLNKSGAAFVEEFEHTGPIAGEAFTRRPKQMPYDRPAQISDPQEVLEKVFYMLGEPKIVRKLLALLNAKIPLDMIVAPLLAQLSSEGVVSPHTAILISPAITVMIARMAEAADIDYKLSLDDDDVQEVTEDEIRMAQLAFKQARKNDEAIRTNEISRKELVDKSKKISLMQKPESLV